MTIRNFTFAAISSGSAVLMALVYFVAAQVLGVEQFGLFTYALAVSVIGEALIDMGLHQLTIREVAQAPDRRLALMRTQLALKLFAGAGVVVAGLAGSYWIQPDATSLIVVGLMLLSSVLRSWFMSVRGVLLGLESFGLDAALVTGDRAVLTLVGTVVLLAGGDVVALAATFLACRLVTVAVTVALTRRTTGLPSVSCDPAAWHALHRQARPLGLFVILLTAYTYLDTIMLRAMTSDAATGLYGAAYRIYEGGAYAASVVWAVITPRLSALWGTDRAAHGRLARRSLLGGFGLSLPLAAALLLWASQITHLVLGPEYADGIGTLRTLAVGLPFFFCIWVLHGIAVSAGRDGLLVQVTGIAMVVNVALNALLIPLYGPLGAAAATVCSEGVSTAVFIGALWPVLRTGKVTA